MDYVKSDTHKVPAQAAENIVASDGHHFAPAVVVPAYSEALYGGTSSKTEEELAVDHKLGEAHGDTSRRLAAIAASKEVSKPAPGPTPATPVHDSVAHHPRFAPPNQKYDFPNRNPSPTMPIMVKARFVDASFGEEATQMAAEENLPQEIRTETASSRSIKLHSSSQQQQHKTTDNTNDSAKTNSKKETTD